VTREEHGDTRQRLLDAAAGLIAAAPGEEIALRAVCARVGVKMPTLYHFFGNKQGLLDAVAAHGFDLYMAQKQTQESTGDPVQDLREGWDTHVAFGLANPGLYALMYGKVQPGHAPAARARPTRRLRELTGAAAEQGRLVVSADQAAAHILAANVGVTLRQIALGGEGRPLSVAMREATLAAITGTETAATAAAAPETDRFRAIHQVLEFAASRPEVLGDAETQLLTQWLTRLAAEG
jgi:AcrR family transcriptional regulator